MGQEIFQGFPAGEVQVVFQNWGFSWWEERVSEVCWGRLVGAGFSYSSYTPTVSAVFSPSASSSHCQAFMFAPQTLKKHSFHPPLQAHPRMNTRQEGEAFMSCRPWSSGEPFVWPFLRYIYEKHSPFSQLSLVGVQRKCGRTFARSQRWASSEHSGPAAEPLTAW